MWTKPGDQNHKTSCGCAKYRREPEGELKSREINSFTRKGYHHISDWCKVLQAPQIRTTITCCGNVKQIQPWFGKSRLALLKLWLETVKLLRHCISTGVQLIWAFKYWNLKIIIIISYYYCEYPVVYPKVQQVVKVFPGSLFLAENRSLWKGFCTKFWQTCQCNPNLQIWRRSKGDIHIYFWPWKQKNELLVISHKMLWRRLFPKLSCLCLECFLGTLSVHVQHYLHYLQFYDSWKRRIVLQQSFPILSVYLFCFSLPLLSSSIQTQPPPYKTKASHIRACWGVVGSHSHSGKLQALVGK